VQLSFNLPGNSTTLEAKAKVVRVLQYPMNVSSLRFETFPPGNGLVFTEISQDHRRILKEFVGREELRIFGSRNECVEEGGAVDLRNASGY